MYQEESESEPEFDGEEQEEPESELIEKKPKIKKAPLKKREASNIYYFINKKCREG